MKNLVSRFLVAAVLLLAPLDARAADKEVTIGYQLIYSPWNVAIATGAFEKATGWKINWRKFDSGSKVITAIAAGEADIALAGSSPIAAGVGRGIEIEIFWIVEDIASAEALVVREGAGIRAPQDLRSKRLGVPFISTAHFHTLFALEQFDIGTDEIEILNLQPPQITAAWDRGELDAAFVWNPALGHIKKTGRVLITSGHLSSWGRATFDAMVVTKDFSRENPDFMKSFVKVIAAADEAYRSKPEAWTPDSAEVKAIVELVGGDPQDVPGVLALYGFPTLEEQASCRWLGCGEEGGAALALKFTSEFLMSEGKVEGLLPTYTRFVNPAFVEAALGK